MADLFFFFFELPLSQQETFQINSLHKSVLAITNIGTRASPTLSLGVSQDHPGYSLLCSLGVGCRSRGSSDPWPGVTARDRRARSPAAGESRLGFPSWRNERRRSRAWPRAEGSRPRRPAWERGARVASGWRAAPGRRHHADPRAREDARPTRSQLGGALRRRGVRPPKAPAPPPPPPPGANFAVSLIGTELELRAVGAGRRRERGGGGHLAASRGRLGLFGRFPQVVRLRPVRPPRALEKGMKERAGLEGGSAAAPARWKVQGWPWTRRRGAEAGRAGGGRSAT